MATPTEEYEMCISGELTGSQAAAAAAKKRVRLRKITFLHISDIAISKRSIILKLPHISLQ